MLTSVISSGIPSMNNRLSADSPPWLYFTRCVFPYTTRPCPYLHHPIYRTGWVIALVLHCVCLTLVEHCWDGVRCAGCLRILPVVARFRCRTPTSPATPRPTHPLPYTFRPFPAHTGNTARLHAPHLVQVLALCNLLGRTMGSPRTAHCSTPRLYLAPGRGAPYCAAPPGDGRFGLPFLVPHIHARRMPT